MNASVATQQSSRLSRLTRSAPSSLGARTDRIGTWSNRSSENWQRMRELSDKTTRPFAFRVPPQGSAIDGAICAIRVADQHVMPLGDDPVEALSQRFIERR